MNKQERNQKSKARKHSNLEKLELITSKQFINNYDIMILCDCSYQTAYEYRKAYKLYIKKNKLPTILIDKVNIDYFMSMMGIDESKIKRYAEYEKEGLF